MKRLSEINEGVFRNSIIRTSGTGLKRREDNFGCNAIDLGLPSGTLWCDRNVGAKNPEDFGGFYQWGGTEDMRGKNCDWNGYPYGDHNLITKYCENDGKMHLDPEDDIAHLMLGGEWHIPTTEQIEEIIKNTYGQVIAVNGVNGILLKSKRNENSIFIPYSGTRQESIDVSVNRRFELWGNERVESESMAIEFRSCGNFYDDSENLKKFKIEHGNEYRYVAMPIRGVIGG